MTIIDTKEEDKMHVRERKMPLSDSEGNPLITFIEDFSSKNSKLPKDEVSFQFPIRPAFKSLFDEQDAKLSDEMMSKCCCCLTTKNGSILIGVVCLALSFCVAVGSSFLLINADEMKYYMTTSYEFQQQSIRANLSEGMFIVDSMFNFSNFISNFQLIFIVSLVFSIIYTFSSLFLTYGACNSLRFLLLPWIVLEIVPFGMHIAIIVLVFVHGKNDPIIGPSGSYAALGLVLIVILMLHIYIWMCPVAHYKNLKDITKVESLVPPNHPLSLAGHPQKY